MGEGIVVLPDDIRGRPHLEPFVGRYIVRQVDFETPSELLGVFA
jgi:hypothetical protein